MSTKRIMKTIAIAGTVQEGQEYPALFLGGPLDGEIKPCGASRYVARMHLAAINHFGDKVSFKSAEEFAYEIHRVFVEISPFFAERRVALPAGSIGSRLPLPSAELRGPGWSIKEREPDFLDEFDEWLARQIAVHCPWTMESAVRQDALDEVKRAIGLSD